MSPRMWFSACLTVVLVVGAVAVADITDANGAATLLGIIVATTVGMLLFVRSYEPD